MGYPDADSFDGFTGDCKNKEMINDLQEVLDRHGYGPQFVLVSVDREGMEIHAPIKPRGFQLAAHALADAALQVPS